MKMVAKRTDPRLCEWIQDPETVPVVRCESDAVAAVEPVSVMPGVPEWVQVFRLCGEHEARGRDYYADLLRVDLKTSPC